MEKENVIEIKNARVNNLKGIDIKIPRNKFIVITGVSGSGKSSLAFDTLFAEGQRRYVESLNSYARQFLGRNNKPEVDYIKGIPPAIAIEQKVNTRNPRSTVGTSTEVYDYLKLLFARIGRTFSPISGIEVKHDTVTDVIDYITNLPEGTKVALMTPLRISAENTLAKLLPSLKQQGFSRVEQEGEFLRIDDETASKLVAAKKINLVIDRLSANAQPDTLTRLADSVGAAFFEGDGTCVVRVFGDDKTSSDRTFSERFEADGIKFEPPTEHLFTFNNPIGACPKCEGFGNVIGIDEDLVVPNKQLSVYDDAVACWNGPKLGEWKKEFLRSAVHTGFPVHKPYKELTQEEKDILWHGNGNDDILNKDYMDMSLHQRTLLWKKGLCLPSIDAFFKFVKSQSYKIQYRVIEARFRGKTICPECHGRRLRKEADYVRVAGKCISELVEMPLSELLGWANTVELNEYETKVAERMLTEIRSRLEFLCEVGLEYLTLNRLSSSLSGGESQRINLATSLGSSLVGSLYILDEPSIGLHSRDTDRLIGVLKKLRDLGNTVIVVEHDEDIIRAADEIIDIGPEAGRLGGEVVFQGDVQQLQSGESLTTKYLTGELKIDLPVSRRAWNRSLKLTNVCANNLKDITAEIPLNVMCVVTGVSGSGKSTLIRQVFYPAISRMIGENTGERPGSFGTLTGDVNAIATVEFVDQNPIGRSTRSNPVTYIKAYDEIRKLMAQQQLAKQSGYTTAHFSFNSQGGRCEVCQGEGTKRIEMQFMADIVLECEQCHGKRFKEEILDVRYRGQNIADILDMTINQAIEFFSEEEGACQHRIVQRLKPLQDVGLGYIKLGQSSSTLSGGESQRVKLASFIADEQPQPTLFIFDEPTTGLHFHDIKKLMKAFDTLIEHGHSLVVIEHNMNVIKCADWIIDLGPEGGDKGGQIVAAGTPEQVAQVKESYTGRYLAEYLKKD